MTTTKDRRKAERDRRTMQAARAAVGSLMPELVPTEDEYNEALRQIAQAMKEASMKNKKQPTNHDSWLVHFHVGVRGTPVTTYLMDDHTYQVWFGHRKFVGLTKTEALDKLAHILLSNTKVRL